MAISLFFGLQKGSHINVGVARPEDRRSCEPRYDGKSHAFDVDETVIDFLIEGSAGAGRARGRTSPVCAAGARLERTEAEHYRQLRQRADRAPEPKPANSCPFALPDSHQRVIEEGNCVAGGHVNERLGVCRTLPSWSKAGRLGADECAICKH